MGMYQAGLDYAQCTIVTGQVCLFCGSYLPVSVYSGSDSTELVEHL